MSKDVFCSQLSVMNKGQFPDLNTNLNNRFYRLRRLPFGISETDNTPPIGYSVSHIH